METLQSLPGFEDVTKALAKVHFKKEIQPSVTKPELQDPEEFQKTLLKFGKNIYSKWKAANERNSQCQDTRDIPECQTFYIPIGTITLDDSIPISVLAEKKIVIGRGLRTETLFFSLRKESESIADISLFQHENGFEINHRDVQPQFRQQGFGSMILKAGEEAVQAAATDLQTTQQTFAIVSQLDSIYWFWKNGYRPESDEDWQKLNKVLNGDPGLIITERYFIFEKSIPPEQRYYDVDGIQQVNFKNAFRIRMKRQKEFTPVPHPELEEVIQATHEQAIE